ncbi:AGAP013004-PA [Anopheles gambiae str. PEST]|uniref:AGAP013004-PA n=2 Tax=gambiae species complex TaxID=44542 RepID=F5HM43_ANOGA|nr:AGAP013004-PA [Anopheles gambiae str. PEST]
MDKIRNMTDILHMDRSTHIVPSPAGFRVFGKDFEIHFDRINVTNGAGGDDSSHPQEDYTPTLVKRKTYVWEITRRQPTANITVPVFLGKHEKQSIPPFQNAISPRDSDTQKD